MGLMVGWDFVFDVWKGISNLLHLPIYFVIFIKEPDITGVINELSKFDLEISMECSVKIRFMLIPSLSDYTRFTCTKKVDKSYDYDHSIIGDKA